MDIKQFPFRHKTLGTIFGYVLYSGDKGILIDPNSFMEIEDFCRNNTIGITAITNTHSHGDHTMGNDYFIRKNIPLLSPAEAAYTGHITINDEKIKVLAVPGHSTDSVAFYSDSILISGDTLFNGTVGNCYTGDYEEYFASLSLLISLPGKTKIYAGHDLVDYAAGVIREIDPSNPFTNEYVLSVKEGEIYSTMEMELKVNPFIRWNDPSLDGYRTKLNLPVSTPYERWKAMMTVH